MKRFFQILMASAFIVSMQGCANEPSGEISSANVELKLKGEIQAPISETRVDVNGFETSDKVGVYVSATGSLASQNNALDNVAYSYSNGNLVAPEDGKVYWESKDVRLSVYAYYPYNTTVVDNSAYVFSVAANQSVADDYYNSDFITAYVGGLAPQEAPVSLSFEHALSKVNVSLVAGKGITADELATAEKSFAIGGLVTSGTIDIETGTATAGTAKTTITPMERSGSDYSAVVYPQSGAITFYMEMDGESYSYTTNVDLQAGKQYDYTLSINVYESYTMVLNTTTITTWDDGEDHAGEMSNIITFTDDKFKEYLLNADLCKVTFDPETKFDYSTVIGKIDANGDGEISVSEAERVEFINVKGTGVSNLKELSYFVNLKILLCSSLGLTSLDVSNNTGLLWLDCGYNDITTLDVSKNAQLIYLDCINDKLTSLEVSNKPTLERLNCYQNQLTSLVVLNTPVLSNLHCARNQLTSLDVSNFTALKQFQCHMNLLTSLDISNNTALTYLSCGQNELTELNVSKNTALETISCYQNLLTSLDVSKNTALKSLSCDGNKLTVLDVSENVALTNINCKNNLLTTLDVSKNTALRSLYCNPMYDESENNILSKLYLAEGQSLETLSKPDETVIEYK